MIIVIIKLLLIGVAAAAYALLSHYTHHNDAKNKTSFWGSQSWVRKYKRNPDGSLVAAPKSWYYKLFKLEYKEAFPLSASLFVFVTDYWHACQWVMTTSLFLAFTSTWWGFALLWSIWHLFFNVVYLAKKKKD